MSISNKKVASLNETDAQQLGDRLLSGLLGWAINGSTERFMPHSFVALFDRPIEAIQALYAHPECSPATQRLIRELIRKLGSTCRPGCPEGMSLSDESRFNLLQAYINAVEFVLCFEACEVLGAFAMDGGEFEDCNISRQTAGLAIGCLGKLAMHHQRSSFWLEQYRTVLDNELTRVVHSPFFEVSISPFILAALVSIRPELAIKHIQLCGAHICEWHSLSHAERNLAYLTANRIAEKAPLALLRNFGELSFRFPTSRDRWLVEALFSAEGPFQLFRDKQGANKPQVSVKGRPKVRLRVPHEDWLGFSPPSIVELESAIKTKEEQISCVGLKIQDFFLPTPTTARPN